MADLSNLKISNTFARLLQVDPDTTQLQDGGGANPTVVTFNGTDLKYVDGNQQNNYVLTSDANGVASWAAAGGSDTNVYWSASSVDGTFIVNSGMTNSKVGIGTTIPNHTLSVSGTVSASSHMYAANLRLPGTGIVSFDDSLDGTDQFIRGNDNNIIIDGDDYIKNVIDTEFWVGTSSSTPKFIVDDEGNVRADGTLVVTGNTVLNGTLSATTSCKVGNGDGFISAATIHAQTLSAGTGGFVGTVLVTDNESDNDNNLLVFVGDGADTTGAQSLQMDGDLYYNPSIGKLHVPLTLQMPDSATIKLGGDQDLKLYHNGDDSYIKENGTGDLKIQTNSNVIIEGVGGENCAVFVDEGGVELYYDNTKKFETTTDGVSIEDDLVVTGNTVMNGTLSATTSLKVGNGDGFISATTINAPSISATTLYGTIDGGSF